MHHHLPNLINQYKNKNTRLFIYHYTNHKPWANFTPSVFKRRGLGSNKARVRAKSAGIKCLINIDAKIEVGQLASV